MTTLLNWARGLATIIVEVASFAFSFAAVCIIDAVELIKGSPAPEVKEPKGDDK